MDSVIFLILLQLILIALNAVFASAEIAVLSISEMKLERMAAQGNTRAKRLFRLTQEPARFLATTQVAITLSGFLGSAFAADNFSEPLVDWLLRLGVRVPRATLDTVAVVFITLILSYFTLIFGELVPKRIAMKKPEQLAMGISGLVSGISVVFKPIVWFLSVSTDLVLRLCGIVTTNDLVEELVGDLGEDPSEAAAAEPRIERLDADTWSIIGNASLFDIEQALNVDIGLEEVDTFSGLVFNELGMIPSDGEQQLELTFQGLIIQISRIENHQIVMARVRKAAETAAPSADG